MAGSFYLVLEAADSLADLPSICARRTLIGNELALRSNANRILHCVEAPHKKRLVHCDIKSKHFLRFNGEWKLIDYGSVLEEGDMSVPDSTRKYAAPEVLRRIDGSLSTLAVSHSMDVWALGIVLYELMAGRAPWDDESEDCSTEGGGGGSLTTIGGVTVEGSSPSTHENASHSNLASVAAAALQRASTAAAMPPISPGHDWVPSATHVDDALKALASPERSFLKELLHPDAEQRMGVSKLLCHKFFQRAETTDEAQVSSNHRPHTSHPHL